MNYLEVISRLEAGLQGTLPGEAAQSLLAPRPRRQWPQGIHPSRIRDAAGLLVVFPRSSLAHILLTVRADRLRHGGQVSLPGGVVDDGETFQEAALREAEEEVGLAPATVRILGPLTPLDIPVSGFRLHPIVGALARQPTLRASDGEVARILEIDLDHLVEASTVVETERTRDGRVLQIPAFRVDGEEVWGATAMVLAEFLTLLGWTLD
ncbi:MAG TPA: CoA pyrophosphatase [Vicinamibacterales bacterium]